MKTVIKTFHSFSYKNPAFVFSLFFILGILAKLKHLHFLLLFPLLIKNKKNKVISIIFILSAFFFCKTHHPDFPKIDTPAPCSAIFIPQAKMQSATYKKGYTYKGKLKTLNVENKTYYNIPCKIKNIKKKLPLNYSYSIDGFCLSTSEYNVSLKATKTTEIKKICNFIDLRENVKKRLSRKIKKHIKSRNSSCFFQALLTGSLNDKFLKFSFQRTGLQHILAISGFHFGLLICFFCFLLKKIVPFRFLPYSLFLIATGYFFYIGFSPSIFRAYLFISIFLLNQILNKKNYALNNLGLCAIVELLIDPLIIFNLGFLLSFLSVAAILIIYPTINDLISKQIKKRTKKEIENLDFFSKIGAVLCNFIRESFSLTLSINLIIFPIILFYFHKFPLISIFYNLIFPPLLLISLILLFSSFTLLLLCPHLSKIFFEITNSFTSFILKTLENPPTILEYSLYGKNIPSILIIIYIISCFCFFIFFVENRTSKQSIFIF